jgi:long-chain acyl-CoA synthetase
MAITAADLNFGAIPFSHSYGFSNLVTPLLTHGVPLVATEERLPRALWEGVQRTGATVFPGLPVFFEKLAALDGAREPAKLRLCISAGAPLLASVAGAFTRSFGLKIHSFYGSSECGGICYDRSAEPNYDDGWVGQPLDGVRLERMGERIAVHSAAVGDGYFPTPDLDVLGGGRFVPGDLVEERNGGYAIVGRSTDVINIAGRKLNPGEIEGRIAAFPGVRQVVVFGVPSALRGEEPVACVCGSGIEPPALQRHCREQLSAWQMPRDFWIVDEIPVNERGKVSRSKLAKDYAAQRAHS